MKAEHREKLEKCAVLIQKVYRMWRAKTLYQQLMLYKAQKETQLIYFGQQVKTESEGWAILFSPWETSTFIQTTVEIEFYKYCMKNKNKIFFERTCLK